MVSVLDLEFSMWPFNRNKQSPQVPEEVQDYYRKEQRERVGVAWILAIISLIITVALAVGIFFAGKWVWHKIKGNDQTATETAQTTTETSAGSNTSAPGESSTSSPSNANTSGSQPASTKSQTSSKPGQTATTQTLANTGPGDVIRVFVVVSLLGWMVSELYTRSKAKA